MTTGDRNQQRACFHHPVWLGLPLGTGRRALRAPLRGVTMAPWELPGYPSGDLTQGINAVFIFISGVRNDVCVARAGQSGAALP